MKTIVNLSWHEAAMAAEVGRMRQLASIKAGLRDAYGCKSDGWSEHIEGACGEMAVAKHLGIYWDGSVNTFSRDDLPVCQVRTRSDHSYDLIIRPQDKDESRFVLVTGKCPQYIVHGWIKAAEGKKPEFLREHGGRPAAYFVPKDILSPIETLL